MVNFLRNCKTSYETTLLALFLWPQLVETNVRARNAIRKAQLEELEKLLDQKHEIENEITVSLHTVNQVFAEVSEQFATVLRGRAHELE